MQTWHIQVYKFDKVDIEGLRNHMEEFYRSFISEADKLTLEENWRSFESTIIKATDAFIPSSYKSSRFNLPWVNRPLKRIIRRKHRAFYKANAGFRLTCLPHCRFDHDICSTAQAPLAAEG